MNETQRKARSHGDNLGDLSPEAVSTTLSILRHFFDAGADWAEDIVPNLPCDGIGLLAVEAAEAAQRRAGRWAVIDAMLRFFWHQLKTCGNDVHVELALATIEYVRPGSGYAPDDELSGELDEACTPMVGVDYSFLGYCLLQVAQAALQAAGGDDDSPADWASLNITNQLASKFGRHGALEFVQTLRNVRARRGSFRRPTPAERKRAAERVQRELKRWRKRDAERVRPAAAA